MPGDTRSDSEIELSIVTTLYYSAPYLAEFCRRVGVEAEKLTSHYEIILVNDGSPDASLDEALRLQQSHPQIRIVDLSRNFGQHKAMMTGFEQSRGRLIFLIDCDLEEDPELLGLFHEEMQASGADVVYGVQSRRNGSWFKRISGDFFYKSFEFFSNFPIPSNPLNARLMSRRYVESLLVYREREFYMAGLWAMTGYKQVSMEVVKQFKGSSTYSFRKKMAMAVDAMVSFSNRPLEFIFYLGAAIMLVSGTAAAVLVVRRIFFNVYLSGWPSLIVSIWLLGGMTIFCLGIIGIYLAKIFSETKQRPHTIIRGIYQSDSSPQMERPESSGKRYEIPHPHLSAVHAGRRSDA